LGLLCSSPVLRHPDWVTDQTRRQSSRASVNHRNASFLKVFNIFCKLFFRRFFSDGRRPEHANLTRLEIKVYGDKLVVATLGSFSGLISSIRGLPVAPAPSASIVRRETERTGTISSAALRFETRCRLECGCEHQNKGRSLAT